MEIKRYAACRFCILPVMVTEASERETYEGGYDYAPGEYYVGTCLACHMRDCHHVSETEIP